MPAVLLAVPFRPVKSMNRRQLVALIDFHKVGSLAMKGLRLVLIIASFSFCAAQFVSAGTATFDFDHCTPVLTTGMSTPLDQTCSGISGHFSSTHDGYQGGGYSVQSDATTGYHMSQFSANYLWPNGLDPGRLDISLNQSVTSITFTFATADFGIETPTTIQMDAYLDSNLVGSMQSHGTYGSDTMPMGTLSYDSGGRPFNRIEIWIPQAGGASTDVLVDNMILTQAPTTGLQFLPLAPPCRAVDTRPANGGGGPIQSGTQQDFAISNSGTCGTIASAAAYSMNVSVVPNGPLGYLTVWPAGQPKPLASTLNSLDGRIKANAAIIPAGANGKISVYATSTTNVIVDVNGYFTPISPSTLAFYPLPPCRIADTRKSNFPQGLGPPFLTGGIEREFPIRNATSCNIPTGVAAYSLNFSVVPHGSLFYMTVWPSGEPRPIVSTLNDIPGTVIANAAIVVAGISGDVSVYPTNDTDLIIDINGYFAPQGTGGLSLYGVQPCRVIDTRHGGSGPPFSGTLNPPVDVANSGCGTFSSAKAYVFNASVVPQGSLGYLTLWPNLTNRPVVSTLNALDGSISSNMAIVPSTNGKVDAYASGITQLILDISSYFAP
jgi:hypothetical protein